MNFRDIIDEYRSRGRVYARPLSMGIVAKRFGISRSHLYYLIAGQRGATDWTVRRIARATKYSVAFVRAAITKSATRRR
jgi:predicted DNA-binding transcriptional regulator AlpA